jgi:thiamine biosynthesis lipoprotein
VRHVEHVMGTVFSLVAREDVDPLPAVARLHEIDRAFSPYRPDSTISRMARNEPIEYDAETAEVLDRCREIEQDTDGYFTMYPDGRLDPSGWVKGWAIEEVSRLLGVAGSKHHCVTGGGDVQAVGRSERGGAWRIGIAHPMFQGQFAAVVQGSDFAVATSGTAERGEHIVDPVAGLPANGFLSVTLIGAGIARTDAYATAVFAMGPELGMAWAERRAGIEAFGILPDGSAVQTSGFGRYLL